MSDEGVNTKGLDQLIKALGGRIPEIRIGVLGGGRNAEVGAAHEYGTKNLPKRSFLRVPIADNLDKALEESGAFDREALAQTIQQGTLEVFSQKIAAIAKGIVLEAFATGGFGKWKPWKNKNYENNTGQILVDTHQLRDSIDSEVR